MADLQKISGLSDDSNIEFKLKNRVTAPPVSISRGVSMALRGVFRSPCPKDKPCDDGIVKVPEYLQIRLLVNSVFLALMIPSSVFAANISNHIAGIGPNGSIKPYFCIQNTAGQITPLAPNKSLDGNAASGNLYYVGGALRFNGCSESDSYLGYLGVSLSASGSNSISTYSPPEAGVHVAFSNPSISSSGIMPGAIVFTPIDINHNLVNAPSSIPVWQYAGVNLSGLEFDKVVNPTVVPNLSITDKDTAVSDLANLIALINGGINTIRVPISWDYLQMDGPGKGSISSEYYVNFVRPLIATLTHAHVYTIIDMHNYMRYSIYGEQYSGCGADGACPDGTLVTDSAAYKSVWGQLLDLLQNDKEIDINYVLLDLMNEPVNVPDDLVFTIQADLINFVRSKNFTGPILVEGNSWTGLHSWTTETWVGSKGLTYSNATLFTRDNFSKAGINDLSNIFINVHQYLDSDYSGTGDHCQTDLSTIGPNGFNLDKFVQYLKNNQLKAIVTEFGAGKDSNSCKPALTGFLQYLKDNAADSDHDYGFVGWTAWSSGHGWGDYNLLVAPNSYQWKVLGSFLSTNQKVDNIK